MNKLFTTLAAGALLLGAPALLGGCDSVLDIDPNASIDASRAFDTPRGAQVAVQGNYDILQSANYYGLDGVAIVPDLFADDLITTGTFANLRNISNRNIVADNASFLGIWRTLYAGIGRANNVIAFAPGVPGISQAEVRQYTGEAYFLRALHYFNLANYFGGVPIVTTPTRTVGEVENRPRASADEVYALVEQDLRRIIDGNLLAGFDAGPGRASEGAAKALLARLYLYRGRYADAGALADDVIRNYGYTLIGNFNALYEAQNTTEAIFEVQFNQNDSNSHAFFFFPASNAANPAESGGRRMYAPRPSLVNAYSEPGDVRFARTIGNAAVSGNPVYYGRKYFRITSSDDNFIVLRLADMLLIRAEAAARAGQLVPALADLNRIRERAGLPALVALSQEALIDAILLERRRELAFEGHRFWDLKRTGRAQATLGIDATRLLFPIPQTELDVNPALTQNPGY
ncbi:MAG: RagB/SusD family nutrient uptake outer membrane protein [Rubricoccaceae bacterium]